MHSIAPETKLRLPDVSAFLETVKRRSDLFAADGSPVYVARAPGRLDLMGGIADYSGSLVLQMPIREAALVALQRHDSPVLRIESLGAEENNRSNRFEMPLAEFEANGRLIPYAEAREKFRRDAANHWAAYVAGAFLVLGREKNFRFENGARILIDSKVPEGKGVSSSAAIEVATMSATAAAFGVELDRRELAILCQTVENLIVGAPCGIMDQMSSAAGEADRLLAMICQPAEVQGAVAIPPGVAVWGIDSGVRHSVGAGDYGSVRTGAFIGYRIIAAAAGLKVENKGNGAVGIADEKWNGYLANIMPEEFERDFAARLPREISGADFLTRYGGITDTVTRVAPGVIYPVFYPTAHPIYENRRVRIFAELLAHPLTEDVLNRLGRLMYESHESYSACGLGTAETDWLVEAVERSKNLYGARMTGGGSGGTVAVLGRCGADAEIEKIARDYEKQSGYRPYVFAGSSMGAAAFGHLEFGL